VILSEPIFAVSIGKYKGKVDLSLRSQFQVILPIKHLCHEHNHKLMVYHCCAASFNPISSGIFCITKLDCAKEATL
jgi:hypothetical protein